MPSPRLFGIASALITKDWQLSSAHLAISNSTMLAAAFVGALVFERYADLVGRKRVYWLVAAIMIAGRSARHCPVLSGC